MPFADVAASTSWPDARHSVIHAYFPSDRALAQMAAHRIAAVIQPTFLYWEGDLIFRDVGERRAANYKPARKYLDAGVVLCATSDIPSTVSPDPFAGLYALVTRKNNLGHTVAADQAISRAEALRAYTVGGSWLTREEHLKGTLAPGKLADLIVLDRDYFTVPDAQIKEIQCADDDGRWRDCFYGGVNLRQASQAQFATKNAENTKTGKTRYFSVFFVLSVAE
jgi:predicted amidohydrolase YtcJ